LVVPVRFAGKGRSGPFLGHNQFNNRLLKVQDGFLTLSWQEILILKTMILRPYVRAVGFSRACAVWWTYLNSGCSVCIVKPKAALSLYFVTATNPEIHEGKNPCLRKTVAIFCKDCKRGLF